jgi:hypothetical protein
MKIIPSKSKAVRFTRPSVNVPLNFSIMSILIPDDRRCKYLGIILRSDLICADQVNFTVERDWKALHFKMRIPKKRNCNTKCSAYMSLVRLTLEYGAACWDPYREGQISAIDREQKKRPNLRIIRTVRTGKFWLHVENYRAYVPSSKRTRVNGRGNLLKADCNGNTIRAGWNMIGKLGVGGKRRTWGNICL